MKMSENLVNAYVKIIEKIKTQKAVMAELREEERLLMMEISDFLNQRDEIGLQIDENTVITLVNADKKITRPPKAYKNYLKDLCSERGLPDEEFVDAILSGKVETTVQQQKLKIVKKK